MFPNQPTRRLALATLTALLAPALTPLAGCGVGSDAPQSPPAPPSAQPQLGADGLSGRVVQRLRHSPAGLLAATDAGLFRRGARGWTRLTPDRSSVHDVVAVGDSTLIASVGKVIPAPGLHSLIESVDGGQTWRLIDHDFGGPDGPEAVQALVNDAAGGRLLATGHDVLAESIDLGRSWRRLAGEWHAFTRPKSALAVDPVRGDVWYGGQDAIEGLSLFRWRGPNGPVDAYPGLMPSPSVAKGIRFAIGQPPRVLVSGEGGIVQTLDNGGRWQDVLRNGHRFYFDVIQDVQRPQRWITAGWDKAGDQPQPLVVEISDDDGRTWARHQHPDRTLFGGVWSLALVIEEGRSVVYLGLDGGGVYRLTID